MRPLRILVIRYRFIGDTLLAIPALKNLRAAFPDAVIDVLAEPVSGDVLAHCPLINEVLTYAPRLKGAKRRASPHPTSLLGVARLLRSRRYDRCYLLRRSFSGALVPFLGGIPHRVGFATQGSSLLLTRSTRYHEDKHEVECFLDVLRADGIPITTTANENWSDPAVDAAVATRLGAHNRKRVFVCAKSTNIAKDWVPERFAALIAWLVNERNCEIHLCDSPANAACYDAIRNALPAKLAIDWTDWSRELKMKDTGSLIRQMDLAVGIDTGLLHLAAAFHVPVVALFGPQNPALWHPWDTRYAVVRPSDTSGERPLLRVDVATVCRAVDSLQAPPPI